MNDDTELVVGRIVRRGEDRRQARGARSYPPSAPCQAKGAVRGVRGPGNYTPPEPGLLCRRRRLRQGGGCGADRRGVRAGGRRPLKVARYTEPFTLLVAELAYEGDEDGAGAPGSAGQERTRCVGRRGALSSPPCRAARRRPHSLRARAPRSRPSRRTSSAAPPTIAAPSTARSTAATSATSMYRAVPPAGASASAGTSFRRPSRLHTSPRPHPSAGSRAGYPREPRRHR